MNGRAPDSAPRGKNKVRRKKRISKHVQDAEDRRKAKAEGGEGEKAGEGQAQQQQNGTSSGSSAKKKKRSANRHVKDPAEAASYLSSWKHREAGSGWRFNTNTQAWLLRHMYETEKVPKATFTNLVEYLVGCQGMTRRRLREDAARRALRYKEYEKKTKSNDSEEKATSGGDGGDNEAEATEAAAAQKKDTEDDGNAEAEWKALDDHDKRKEYKRARKILDAIKEEE